MDTDFDTLFFLQPLANRFVIVETRRLGQFLFQLLTDVCAKMCFPTPIVTGFE